MIHLLFITVTIARRSRAESINRQGRGGNSQLPTPGRIRAFAATEPIITAFIRLILPLLEFYITSKNNGKPHSMAKLIINIYTLILSGLSSSQSQQ